MNRLLKLRQEGMAKVVKKIKKRLKSTGSVLLVMIICSILGFTIWIPGHATKDNVGNNPIAIMLDQGNGNYVESASSSFTQEGYKFDHAQCQNGSIVTEKEDGISVKFTGSDHCTLYYTSASDLQLTSIKVNGAGASSIPESTSYTVTADCGDTATGSWNYADWSLDISSPTKSSIKCSLEFNTPDSYNYLNTFLNNNKGTTQGASAAKGQLVNEKGVRYEGSDPYNYVSFNGELWRIIGMFAFNKSTNVEVNGGSTNCTTYNCYTKIIRNDSIGSYSFSALGTTSSTAYNYWEKTDGTKATLNKLLNTYYYNPIEGEGPKDGTNDTSCGFRGNIVKGKCDFTSTGIQLAYKPMVQNVVWNLGGYTSGATTQAMYGYERGSNRQNNTYALTASGYIGLMYPSDYGYSVQSSNCSRTGVNLSAYGTAECGEKAWLLKNGYEWTITHVSNATAKVLIINSFGFIGNGDNSFVYNGFSVRPVLYLTDKVYIVSGSGKESDPYVLGLDIRS